jgi:phenylacetate-CoA ligase
LRARNLKLVITNAEALFPWQRAVIREGLGCESRETYGQAEILAAASECQAGALHQWPEVGQIEILDDDEGRTVAPGESGRLVSTSLLNDDMPFVRYATGDRARTAAPRAICGCGRELALIGGIEGRTNDLLRTRDGRRVYWLNPVFYGLPVREAQIIQETLETVRVRYVPAPEFTPACGQQIIERLQARLGEVTVKLEAVAEVPRGRNGKFQAVVSQLPPEEAEEPAEMVHQT